MKKKGILIVLLVLALILAAGSMFTVAEDEYACTVRFSKIIGTTSEAGLHFKLPFVDSVKYFTDATQLYDIPPSEVLTSDKQNMTVDCYILWRISDPKLFYQTLGSTAKAEERLDAITYSALKTDMGTLAQADIINMNDGAERNTIYDDITVKVDAAAKSYGIHVEDVKIKRFDLPESNLNAVYGRMISERNQMAEKYTADGNYDASIIRNDVDKQVNIIVSDAEAAAAKLEAEGEQEYMRLLAEAYDTQDKKDFYEFSLALDALKASLDGDEKTGAKIVLRALEAPLRQIAANAGLEGSIIVDKIRRSRKVGYGFDAYNETYCDMMSSGIVDPTKVTRSALQNAASIASMVLTTESAVANIPKEEPAAAAPAAGGMGGMY